MYVANVDLYFTRGRLFLWRVRLTARLVLVVINEQINFSHQQQGDTDSPINNTVAARQSSILISLKFNRGIQ